MGKFGDNLRLSKVIAATMRVIMIQWGVIGGLMEFSGVLVEITEGNWDSVGLS